MLNYAFYSFAGTQKEENVYYHRRINADYPEKHKCSYWEFLVITKGVVLNCVNDFVNMLYVNDVAWIRPNDLHDILSQGESSFEYVNIMIEDCWVKKILDYIDVGLYEKLKAKKYLQYSFSVETIEEIQDAIRKADEIQSDNDRQIILKPLVLNLITEFVKRSNDEQSLEKNQIVKKAIKLMQKNIRFSIKELSQEMNYSQGYLARCFNKTCKMSPNVFFQKIKLNYARKLLETTDMSIASISQEIGMSGIGYFNKKYMEQFGVLPSKYRKEIKKDAKTDQKFETLL